MRTCEFDNCTQPVFGTDKNTRKGYCRNHQRFRTDKRPKKIAVHSKRERISPSGFGFDNQTELFAQLWENARNEKGEVYCRFTGEKLNFWAAQESWYYCLFAHVLPKKNYPYFKLNPDNICIVAPEFHKIIDQGTLKDREAHPDWKWDEWDALVIETKQKYIEFKKKNLLA